MAKADANRRNAASVVGAAVSRDSHHHGRESHMRRGNTARLSHKGAAKGLGSLAEVAKRAAEAKANQPGGPASKRALRPGLLEEDDEQDEVPRFMVSPDSRCRLGWDIVMLLLIMCAPMAALPPRVPVLCLSPSLPPTLPPPPPLSPPPPASRCSALEFGRGAPAPSSTPHRRP